MSSTHHLGFHQGPKSLAGAESSNAQAIGADQAAYNQSSASAAAAPSAAEDDPDATQSGVNAAYLTCLQSLAGASATLLGSEADDDAAMDNAEAAAGDSEAHALDAAAVAQAESDGQAADALNRATDAAARLRPEELCQHLREHRERGRRSGVPGQQGRPVCGMDVYGSLSSGTGIVNLHGKVVVQELASGGFKILGGL